MAALSRNSGTQRCSGLVCLGHSLLAGALFIGSGCDRPVRTPMERGARIFARTCSSCHGMDGSAGALARMNPPPRDLSSPEFHAQTTPEQIRQVVRLGKGQMPAFGGLMAKDDIDAVVGFIATLARTEAKR